MRGSSYPTGKGQGLMRQRLDKAHPIAAPWRVVSNPSGEAVTNCFLHNSCLQRRPSLISPAASGITLILISPPGARSWLFTPL